MFNFKFSKSHIKEKEVNFSITVNVTNMSKTLPSYMHNRYFVYMCTVTVQCVYECQRQVSGTLLRESSSIFWNRISYPIWNSTIQLHRLDRKTPTHSVSTQQHWDYRYAQHAQLIYMLGIWTQVFMFAQQAFCRLSILPSLHFFKFTYFIFLKYSHLNKFLQLIAYLIFNFKYYMWLVAIILNGGLLHVFRYQ